MPEDDNRKSRPRDSRAVSVSARERDPDKYRDGDRRERARSKAQERGQTRERDRDNRARDRDSRAQDRDRDRDRESRARDRDRRDRGKTRDRDRESRARTRDRRNSDDEEDNYGTHHKHRQGRRDREDRNKSRRKKSNANSTYKQYDSEMSPPNLSKMGREMLQQENPGYQTEDVDLEDLNPEDAVDEQEANNLGIDGDRAKIILPGDEDDEIINMNAQYAAGGINNYRPRATAEQKVWGNLLRTLVVVSNIIFWFSGCALLGSSIWLRFVNESIKKFFSDFQTLEIGLYVMLAAGILFLVIALLGTCGANMKNQTMLVFYIISMSIIVLAEIAGLVMFISYKPTIEDGFANWYTLALKDYKNPNTDSKQIVEYIQSTHKCCGEKGSEDFQRQHGLIPQSCRSQKTISRGNIQIKKTFERGCVDVLKKKASDILIIPFIGIPILLIIQIAGLSAGAMFFTYLLKGLIIVADDVDSILTGDSSDYSSDFSDNKFPTAGELPKPKLFRLLKRSKEGFGFKVEFDEFRRGHIIKEVENEGIAHFARLKNGSRIIELNGLMCCGASSDEVKGRGFLIY